MNHILFLNLYKKVESIIQMIYFHTLNEFHDIYVIMGTRSKIRNIIFLFVSFFFLCKFVIFEKIHPYGQNIHYQANWNINILDGYEGGLKINYRKRSMLEIKQDNFEIKRKAYKHNLEPQYYHADKYAYM